MALSSYVILDDNVYIHSVFFNIVRWNLAFETVLAILHYNLKLNYSTV